MFPPGFLPAVPAAADGKYRLLLVHAHPDDESIATGGTMAYFAHSGAEVSLLTSTRGELGEVIPAELKHLEQGLPGAVDDGGRGLARVREAELGQAVAALGVQQHFFLGQGLALAPGEPATVYRDSGMSWGSDGRAQAAAKVLPGSFSRAPLEEVAGHTAALIRALRPDVVISYAADGGYGHPDHVRTHQMTVAALELAATSADSQHAAWNVPLSYSILSDRAERPHDPAAEVFWIDGELAAKREAMRAHQTQILVEHNRFALSDLSFRPLSAREGFQLLRISATEHQARQGLLSPAGATAKRSLTDWLGYTLSSVLAGVLVAALGTMLHSRTSTLGDWQLPWGALLALVLLGSTITLLSAWARSVTMGLLLGIITYATCVIFSIPRGPAPLILGNLAGSLWLYGIAVVTLLSMLPALIAALRRKAKTQNR
ncbi:PIG-L family deacetylase [Psychromicrobium lacuslunae]|uniref:PIG-L family deacetylase n=1 Tax=Psychromicrobium lacuslunae TaxID=1618207 RepID=UPI0005D43C92|nr:PIG-L family deacetylase [Psychromicrobium lacuslunae]